MTIHTLTDLDILTTVALRVAVVKIGQKQALCSWAGMIFSKIWEFGGIMLHIWLAWEEPGVHIHYRIFCDIKQKECIIWCNYSDKIDYIDYISDGICQITNQHCLTQAKKVDNKNSKRQNLKAEAISLRNSQTFEMRNSWVFIFDKPNNHTYN